MLREFDEPVSHEPPPPRPLWVRAAIWAAIGWWTVMLIVSIWRGVW